jgi:hypothetical protein
MCSFNDTLQIGFFICFILSLFLILLFLFLRKINFFLETMGTREDAMALIDELEELKNFAREHAEVEPNFVRYASDREYKRLWDDLYEVEHELLGEAYHRNIRLMIDGEEVRIRTILDSDLDATEEFKRYLAGKFETLWGNALESFIEYHTEWNALMKRILDADRRYNNS